MPIRPEEIDQTIQNALKDRISQIFAGQAPLDPVAARVRSAGAQAWRETAKRYAGYFWTGGASIATALLTFPILMAGRDEGLAGMVFFLLITAGTGLMIGGSAKARRELTRFVSPDLMRAAASLVSLTRAEQRYCEAVAALIDAGPLVGETVQHEILQQLNTSLENCRKLDAPLQQHRAASGGSAVDALERELAELCARRDTVEDVTAREMMGQSVALCVSRLEHARALAPALEKAAAQQELILQTMASVKESLARSCAAPGGRVEPEVEKLQQSVTQMNLQARSVEEAVAEVVALHA